MLRVVCVCALWVGIAAVIEFRLQHRFLLDLMPADLIAQLAAHNPAFAHMTTAVEMRNSEYRANSIFAVSLSLGEFGAMVAPLGLYFWTFGERFRDRALGVAVVVLAILSVFTSGARGGWMGLIVGVTAFTALWVAREFRFNKSSFAAPSVAVIGVLALVSLILGTIFVVRIHNMILGDGMSTYSDEERRLQWQVGIPKILSNPLIGYGFNGGSDILNLYGEYDHGSIDSGVLETLLEIGVPGFLFLTGMVFLVIWQGVKRFLTDPSRIGALGGALACSALAFAIVRTVLAQRENYKLFFLLAGTTVILAYLDAKKARSPLKSEVKHAFPRGPGYDGPLSRPRAT